MKVYANFFNPLAIAILVFFSSSVLANEPLYYKVGKHFYKKEKYDMSLWFLDRSKENLGREYNGEYYDLLHEIYLKKTEGSLKGKCTNISLSTRYLKRAKKYKFYSQSEFNSKQKRLMDSCITTMYVLINKGKKSRALDKIISACDEPTCRFLSAAYKHNYDEFNQENLTLYCANLKTFLTSKAYSSLTPEEQAKVEEIVKEQFERIFISDQFELLAQFNDRFEKYFSKKIENLSLNFQESLRDTIIESNYSLIFNAKSFYDKIVNVNPELVPEKHLKSFYIQYRYHSINTLVGLSELENNTWGNYNFSKAPVALSVPYGEEFKKVNFSFDEHLLRNIFIQRSMNRINSDDVYEVMNELGYLNVVINNQPSTYKSVVKELCELNYDKIERVLPDILRRDNSDEKYGHILGFVNEIIEEKLLTYVVKRDFKKASKLLLSAAYIQPKKKRRQHLSWFVPYFQRLLDLNATKSMGPEMMLASHLYSTNKKLLELRKQYIIKDYELTHKTSMVTFDEINWTGNIDNCRCGTLSDSYYAKFLERMKFFRRLTGINDNVFLDEKYNKLAQEAALIMDANNLLNHRPLTSYKCYSDKGYQGASHGNLFLGLWSSDCVDGYISDGGVESVGHRRWVINPLNTHFGTGSTVAKGYWGGGTGYNCLVVITDELDSDSEAYFEKHPITWPMNGYFPEEFLSNSNWSFSLVNANLSSAKIVVKQGDVILKIKKEPIYEGRGQPTIVWEVITELKPGIPVEVTVFSIIDGDGNSVKYTYEVLPFSLEENEERSMK